MKLLKFKKIETLEQNKITGGEDDSGYETENCVGTTIHITGTICKADSRKTGDFISTC